MTLLASKHFAQSKKSPSQTQPTKNPIASTSPLPNQDIENQKSTFINHQSAVSS
jgi:hypothetical protein